MKTIAAPAHAPKKIESKSAPHTPRQPQYAWEMTLEQFQQAYFPELCGQRTEAECSSPREAA